MLCIFLKTSINTYSVKCALMLSIHLARWPKFVVLKAFIGGAQLPPKKTDLPVRGIITGAKSERPDE